jgi:hypothetical protein
VQRRLLPLVAKAFAFTFLGAHVVRPHVLSLLAYVRHPQEAEYLSLLEALRAPDAGAAVVRRLGEFHAAVSGTKTFFSWEVQAALETCRQCLGGLGYSAYANLGALLGDHGVWVPGEGDNMVMAQQTARFLLKHYQRWLMGPRSPLWVLCPLMTAVDSAAPLPASLEYLRGQLRPGAADDVVHLLLQPPAAGVDEEALRGAVRVAGGLAASRLRQAALALQEGLASGQTGKVFSHPFISLLRLLMCDMGRAGCLGQQPNRHH